VAGLAFGCRSKQYGRVLTHDQKDLVGNTAAGGEIYKPLIDEAVGKLLARHEAGFQTVGTGVQPITVCFVGVENKSFEEIGDFKEQMYQLIDGRIEQSHLYRPVSRRLVEAALLETRMRPDQLYLPENMRSFIAVLERQGQPIQALLYATLTSGTTRDDSNYQRDYLLTLEMVNVNTGDYDKEQALLRKGYYKSHVGPVGKSKWFGRW
jgi:hypothetical protein